MPFKINTLGVFSLIIKKPFKSYKGDGKFAYACYSIEDHEIVFPFLKQLVDERYRIRYDEGEQEEGVVDALRKHNIKRCEVFMACMSQHFLESPYCLAQLELAKASEDNIYVVYVDGGRTVDQVNKLFPEGVNSITLSECDEDVMLDIMNQLLKDCQDPPKVEDHVYTYEELLDEVYPGQENQGEEIFEATVNQDSEKIEKAAASASSSAKKAMTQKRQRRGRELLNAIVVVGVMALIALVLYFLFGDQIQQALHPDEVVNFAPVTLRSFAAQLGRLL